VQEIDEGSELSDSDAQSYAGSTQSPDQQEFNCLSLRLCPFVCPGQGRQTQAKLAECGDLCIISRRVARPYYQPIHSRSLHMSFVAVR